MQALNMTVPTLKRKESTPKAALLQAMQTVKPVSPKLIDRLREALRARHYSRRTEQTYCHWVKRYSSYAPFLRKHIIVYQGNLS